MDRRRSVFTRANLLTLVRVPLAGLVWAAPHSRAWLLAILLLAAASDVLDGRIARAVRARALARGADERRVSEAQRIGTWLDPLCDKLFVLSVVVMVAYAYRPPLNEPLLIATREIILLPALAIYGLTHGGRRRQPLDFRARRAGKATTAIQFLAIGAIVFWPRAALPLAIAAAAVGLVTSVLYLVRSARIVVPRQRPRRHAACTHRAT